MVMVSVKAYFFQVMDKVKVMVDIKVNVNDRVSQSNQDTTAGKTQDKEKVHVTSSYSWHQESDEDQFELL